MNAAAQIEQANIFRKAGQYELADKILDELIAAEPYNDEFLFYKALNSIKTNPLLAIQLFTRVLEINPEAGPAFDNIRYVAKQSNMYEEAIMSMNAIIQKHPNKPELFCERGAVFQMKNEPVNALIDFYEFIWASKMSPEQFLESPISERIAISKVELQKQRDKKILPKEHWGRKSPSYTIKKYQYPLPRKLFGDEYFVFDFGEMLGKSVKDILETNPEYILWCTVNLENFCVTEDVLEILRRKGLDISEGERINFLKLKTLDAKEYERFLNDEE